MKHLLFSISIFLCACGSSSQQVSNATAVSNESTQEIQSDSAQIVHVIQSFTKWYKENYHAVNGVKFTSTNSMGNYQVNLDECKKFLANLSGSGFISQEYVKAWTKYFESRVDYFKENAMDEGPPEGFDYDLVFLTQEPELVCNDVEKMSFTISKDDEGKTIAMMSGELGYAFEMGKEEGKWKIDYIATMNYD